MPAAPSSKAIRLLAEGRVAPATAPVQEFIVDGDHGRYRVFISAHTQVCTCPAKAVCSHIDAAVTRVTATDTERALMDEALTRRRQRDAAEADALFARPGA